MTSLVLNVSVKDKIKTLQKNLLRILNNKKKINTTASDFQSWKFDLDHAASNTKFKFRMLHC